MSLHIVRVVRGRAVPQPRIILLKLAPLGRSITESNESQGQSPHQTGAASP